MIRVSVSPASATLQADQRLLLRCSPNDRPQSAPLLAGLLPQGRLLCAGQIWAPSWCGRDWHPLTGHLAGVSA
jgi:hypothetical protein